MNENFLESLAIKNISDVYSHNLYYEIRAKNDSTDIDLLKFIKSNQMM